MATSRETVAYVLEQLEPLAMRAQAMFGEYCLYCDEKVVAFVCDDTVFLKPAPASDGLPEGPAYAGSKDHRIAAVEIIEDAERFRALIRDTAAAMPAPRPRRRRA